MHEPREKQRHAARSPSVPRRDATKHAIAAASGPASDNPTCQKTMPIGVELQQARSGRKQSEAGSEQAKDQEAKPKTHKIRGAKL